jgi:hypothetical protein
MPLSSLQGCIHGVSARVVRAWRHYESGLTATQFIGLSSFDLYGGYCPG